MRLERKTRHVVDVLFAAALFGVFLISSVMVIAVGAGAYRNVAEQSEQDYTLRTSLSYVSQKLRQADQEGALSLGTVGGKDALMFSSEHEGVSYTTYIYEHNGSLCELFTKSDAPADPDYGTALLSLTSFETEVLNDSLCRISITDSSGRTSSLLLHPFSSAAKADRTESEVES